MREKHVWRVEIFICKTPSLKEIWIQFSRRLESYKHEQ